MKPYYERAGIRLFHGDSREVLRDLVLEERVVVVTDPVWPNGARAFPGIDPEPLFREAVAALAPHMSRLIVILGCDSDPRFLLTVPQQLPFVRVCRLVHAFSSHKGMLLVDAEFAYVFGESFANGNGTHRLLPGQSFGRPANLKRKWSRPGQSKAATTVARAHLHPCPRNPDHMLWLIENFTRTTDHVVDPFSGSGTTLWACRELGRRATGIEIEERWCAQSVERLAQDVLFPPGGVTT